MDFPSVDIEELLNCFLVKFVNDILTIDSPSRLKMSFRINELGELLIDSKLKNVEFKLTENGELELVYMKNERGDKDEG